MAKRKRPSIPFFEPISDPERGTMYSGSGAFELTGETYSRDPITDKVTRYEVSSPFPRNQWSHGSLTYSDPGKARNSGWYKKETTPGNGESHDDED